MSMRQTITKGVALAGIAALALAGCSAETPDGGEMKTTLTIYSAESTAAFWVDEFNSLYPNVTVDLLSASSGESIARAAAEMSNPRADVLAAGGDPEGANPGLLRKNTAIDQTNVDPAFIDPAGFNTPMMKTPVIFIYNTNALGNDAVPTTWAELADPKWKGRIQMGNPLSSEAAYKAMATWWAIGGWDLVEAIAQNAIVTAGSGDAMPAVSNGEAAIGVGLEQLVYQWVDGGTVKAGYPSDGVIFHAGSWFLINNAPNPEDAEKFINFILTPDAQQKMAVEYPGMRPIITNVPGNPDLPSIEELNTIDFPLEAQRDRPEWRLKWEDIMTSIG